jgi:hypothetical protein
MRKKIYLIVPLLLLAAFAIYYHGYRKEADLMAQQREIQQAELQKKEAKEKAQYQLEVAAKARDAAIAKAKKEAEKQAQIDAEEKEYEVLNKEQVVVMNSRDEAAQKFGDLSATLRDENDLAERARNRMSILADEKKFLDTYIPLSKANRDRFSAFLTKVEETQKAVEAAAAAAKKN